MNKKRGRNMLHRLLFLVIAVAIAFFVGYYGAIAGWLPVVSDWFTSWIGK